MPKNPTYGFAAKVKIRTGAVIYRPYRQETRLDVWRVAGFRDDVLEVIEVEGPLTDEQYDNLVHNLRHLESNKARRKPARTR